MWPYGEFSNIKLSNPIDDFENLFDCNIFFKVKMQLPPLGGWLNSNIDHPYSAIHKLKTIDYFFDEEDIEEKDKQ